MTVRRYRSRWILSAMFAVLAMAPPVRAAQGDVAATHAYIQADYALAKRGVASIPAVQAKVQALNVSLAQRCPHAGAGSGESEATQPMAHEVVSDLWAISYGYNAGPIASFVAKVKRLRWSNARITRIVARQARSLREMATLREPDLCADVRAWAASGFTVIPPGVTALDGHAEAIQLEAVPARLLAPYERGSDPRLAGRTAALETKLEEQEFSLGQSDWIEILETLAMNQ